MNRIRFELLYRCLVVLALIVIWCERSPPSHEREGE